METQSGEVIVGSAPVFHPPERSLDAVARAEAAVFLKPTTNPILRTIYSPQNSRMAHSSGSEIRRALTEMAEIAQKCPAAGFLGESQKRRARPPTGAESLREFWPILGRRPAVQSPNVERERVPDL